jgi:hypothetical protein
MCDELFMEQFVQNFEVLKQKEKTEFDQIQKNREDYLEKIKLEHMNELRLLKSKQKVEMDELLNQLKSKHIVEVKSLSENWMKKYQETSWLQNMHQDYVSNSSNEVKTDDESISLEVLKEIDCSLSNIAQSKKRKLEEDEFRKISKKIIIDATNKICDFWSILDKMGTSTLENIYPTLVPNAFHGCFDVAREYGQSHPRKWMLRTDLKQIFGSKWHGARGALINKKNSLSVTKAWKPILPQSDPSNGLYVAKMDGNWYFIYWCTTTLQNCPNPSLIDEDETDDDPEVLASSHKCSQLCKKIDKGFQLRKFVPPLPHLATHNYYEEIITQLKLHPNTWQNRAYIVNKMMKTRNEWDLQPLKGQLTRFYQEHCCFTNVNENSLGLLMKGEMIGKSRRLFFRLNE